MKFRSKQQEVHSLPSDRQAVEAKIGKVIYASSRLVKVSAATTLLCGFLSGYDKRPLEALASTVPLGAALIQKKLANEFADNEVRHYAKKKPTEFDPHTNLKLNVHAGHLALHLNDDPESRPLYGNGYVGIGFFNAGTMTGGMMLGYEVVQNFNNATNTKGVPLLAASVAVTALGGYMESPRHQMAAYRRQLDNIDGPNSVISVTPVSERID